MADRIDRGEFDTGWHDVTDNVELDNHLGVGTPPRGAVPTLQRSRVRSSCALTLQLRVQLSELRWSATAFSEMGGRSVRLLHR
jgi:hypothetical protein